MINNAGNVAFVGEITNSAGNLIDNFGIWTSDGGLLAERVREGQAAPGAAPDGTTLFSGFERSSFNDQDEIVFTAPLAIRTIGAATG